MSTRNPAGPISAAAVILFLSSAVAFGQQTLAEQKCTNALNKDGSLVSKAQGLENFLCLKSAGLGTLVGTAQACLTADAKGKVQKKKDKTTANGLDFCAAPPSFGFTGAAAVNTAAVQRQVALVADIFGASLDAGLIACATSKPGCLCQQKVLHDAELLAATKLGEFVLCKKQVLKAGATSAASLVACVNDAGTPGSIKADTKSKIQKKLAGLNADILKKCDTPGVTGAFPGGCTALTGAALGTCLDARVECRVCQTINDMDGLFVDCDLFDDGLANASCANPTPPASIFRGALLPSTGRFTYNAVIGLPGADAACNTSFAGAHACTFADLQAAQAAGDLVGATDLNSNLVTSFWAIDSTHTDVTQCHQTIAWDYQTAHTGHFAEVTALNNPAGTLGAVTPGLCLNQSWVGCCM